MKHKKAIIITAAIAVAAFIVLYACYSIISGNKANNADDTAGVYPGEMDDEYAEDAIDKNPGDVGVGGAAGGAAGGSADKVKGAESAVGKYVEAIPLKYDMVAPFIEGMAQVWLDGKTGFVDKDGNEAVPLVYDESSQFSEGLAIVDTITSKGESDEIKKYGYVDKTGAEVTPLKYDYAEPFYDGLAYVGRDSKYCFINQKGEEVTALADHQFRFYNEKLLVVDDVNGQKLIDLDGNDVTTKSYYTISKFKDGYAVVEEMDGYDSTLKYGFIDRAGKEITPIIYDSVTDFYEGYAAVAIGDKAGFIDTTGREAIPLKFDYESWFEYYKSGYRIDPPMRFSEGYATVMLNGKWGYIDKAGNEIIPIKYDYATAFSEGMAAVQYYNKWGFIDNTGKVEVPFMYDYAEPFANGRAAVIVRRGYTDVCGYIDKNGFEKVPLKYQANTAYKTFLYPFTEDLSPVIFDNAFGYVNRAGVEVIPIKYDDAGPFSDGMAPVMSGEKWGYVGLTPGFDYNYEADADADLSSGSDADAGSGSGSGTGSGTGPGSGSGSQAVVGGREIMVVMDEVEIKFDVKPRVTNGIAMIPARRVAEVMGAEVNWYTYDNYPYFKDYFNEENGLDPLGTGACVEMLLDGKTIVMRIGDSCCFLDRKKIDLGTQVVLIDDRTLLPVEFFTDVLGVEAEWNESSDTLIIATDTYADEYELDNEMDLLNGRLSILMPKSAVRDTVDVSGVDPENYNQWESRLVYSKNFEYFEVVAYELYRCSCGDFAEDVNTYKSAIENGASDSGGGGGGGGSGGGVDDIGDFGGAGEGANGIKLVVSDVITIDDAEMVIFTPVAILNMYDAEYFPVKSALIKMPDDLLIDIGVFANQYILDNREDCLDFFNSVLKTIKVGGRSVDLAAHKQPLWRYEADLPEGFICSLESRDEYDIYYIEKITEMSEALKPYMGIYLGVESSYSMDSNDPNVEVVSDTLIGGEVGWLIYRENELTRKETIIDIPYEQFPMVMHIFITTDNEADLDMFTEIAHSIKMVDATLPW